MDIKHKDHVYLCYISISENEFGINNEHCPKHSHNNKYNWVHALVSIVSESVMSFQNSSIDLESKFTYIKYVWTII